MIGARRGDNVAVARDLAGESCNRARHCIKDASTTAKVSITLTSIKGNRTKSKRVCTLVDLREDHDAGKTCSGIVWDTGVEEENACVHDAVSIDGEFLVIFGG